MYIFLYLRIQPDQTTDSIACSPAIVLPFRPSYVQEKLSLPPSKDPV